VLFLLSFPPIGVLFVGRHPGHVGLSIFLLTSFHCSRRLVVRSFDPFREFIYVCLDSPFLSLGSFVLLIIIREIDVLFFFYLLPRRSYLTKARSVLRQ